MNKPQASSVPKINCSMQNWYQLENLSNFIKAMISYSLNSMNLFEANDLFEIGNMTQVQMAGQRRPRQRGCRVAWTSASSIQRSRSRTSMTPP